MPPERKAKAYEPTRNSAGYAVLVGLYFEEEAELNKPEHKQTAPYYTQEQVCSFSQKWTNTVLVKKKNTGIKGSDQYDGWSG